MRIASATNQIQRYRHLPAYYSIGLSVSYLSVAFKKLSVAGEERESRHKSQLQIITRIGR